MIKATIKLDVTAIVNEIVSRFDASVMSNVEGGFIRCLDCTDTDELSNICNDAVKSVLDELDGVHLDD